jgi:hypothetical protein
MMKAERPRYATCSRTFRAVAGVAIALAWLSWAQAAPETFMVVAMPDIQNETEHHPEMLQSQITWIVKNRTSLNIVCVSQQGDLTNHANDAEYATAHNAMFRLSKVEGLTWGTCAGNHDLKGETGGTLYDKYFGPANFVGKEWYGTSTKRHGSYQTFAAAGRKYLIVNIGFDAPTPVLQWAQGVIAANPGMPTIINTHDYMAYHHVRSRYGNILFNALVKNNPQVFMVICGHNHDAWHQTSPNAAGKPVFELLADYQSTNSGNGYLRLCQFDEANSVIHVTTYSPYDKKAANLKDEQNQFDLKMNFKERLDAPAELPKQKAAALRIGNAEKSLVKTTTPTGQYAVRQGL